MAILREALATAKSQPVASLVSIVMVAGMCATVLLTTGRTVGAEQAVLGSIDSAGTRSIVVRAEGDAGLDTSVLERLAGIDGIEWAGAFGPAADAANALVPDGTRVPVRLVWGDHLEQLGIPTHQSIENRTAWASDLALEQLGLADGFGGISSPQGADYAIGGEVLVPDYLQFLEPLVVVPQSAAVGGASAPVSVLVVIAERPDLVAPVSKTVQSLLGVDDVTKVTVTTSQSLATLRALVEGQLGTFGRGLVVVIFTLTAILVATILYGLVMLRRKDFGRRRALGASRRLIVGLLLTQMALLSGAGAIVGSAAAAIALAITRDPLPNPEFFAAVGVLAIAVGVVAAVVPAAAAARRDPLRELRVP
jgi:putative ABC transport system permease protein